MAGIVKRTGFQRNSVRANLDQKIGSRIDLGVSSNYINSTNRRGYTGNDNNGIGLTYNLSYIPSYAELHPNEAGIFPESPYTPAGWQCSAGRQRGAAGQTRVSLTQDIGFARATNLLGKEKAALAAAQASGRIYDYEKEIFGNTGALRNTAVNVSGGTERTRFFVLGQHYR